MDGHGSIVLTGECEEKGGQESNGNKPSVTLPAEGSLNFVCWSQAPFGLVCNFYLQLN